MAMEQVTNGATISPRTMVVVGSKWGFVAKTETINDYYGRPVSYYTVKYHAILTDKHKDLFIKLDGVEKVPYTAIKVCNRNV
jgi:hypothetical protein